MLNWLKRNKIKDRKKLHEALVDRGHDVPHHESEDFDSVLPSTLTMDLVSSDFGSTHFEPSVDYSPSVDTSTFDAGGGSSGGGGADGSW